MARRLLDRPRDGLAHRPLGELAQFLQTRPQALQTLESHAPQRRFVAQDRPARQRRPSLRRGGGALRGDELRLGEAPLDGREHARAGPFLGADRLDQLRQVGGGAELDLRMQLLAQGRGRGGGGAQPRAEVLDTQRCRLVAVLLGRPVLLRGHPHEALSGEAAQRVVSGGAGELRGAEALDQTRAEPRGGVGLLDHESQNSLSG